MEKLTHCRERRKIRLRTVEICFIQCFFFEEQGRIGRDTFINKVHLIGTAQLMRFKIISGVKELWHYSCSFIGPTVNPKIPRVKKKE